MSDDKVRDSIARIEAAAAAPAPMIPIELTLSRSGGRTIMLTIPVDMDGAEAMELIGWIARDMPSALEAARERSRIAIARVMPQ